MEQTIKQIGYPRWDKMLASKKKDISKAGRNSSADSTFIYNIPFVRENENYVNASLNLKITGADTTFGYSCDWQYQYKVHGSPNVDSTAERHAVYFMILDFIVFGDTSFIMKDESLFASSNPISGRVKAKIHKNQAAAKSQVLLGDIICVDVVDCGTPSICKSNCDYLACPLEVCSLLYVSCWCPSACSGNDGGDGGGFYEGEGSGAGGNGGSGSGGGGTPPNCTPGQNPPCTPGWIPEEEGNTIIYPCDKANRIKNNEAYKEKAMELKLDAQTADREKSYTESSYGVFLYSEGLRNQDEVELSFSSALRIKSINHNHFDPSAKIFSGLDFATVFKFLSYNMIIDTVFTAGLSIKDGPSYVFTIDDKSKFNAFGIKYFDEDGDIKELVDNYGNYGINKTNSFSENEKRFLEMAKKEKMGISLLKANSDFSGYSLLILGKNGAVQEIPCN